MNKQDKTVKFANIKKNYLFNLAYQLLSLLTPIILMPYLSRVLGSAGIGQYSYSYSIASYFILIGAFGFGYYAQRLIAQSKDDNQLQSRYFWEIMIAKLITTGISLLIFISIILTNIFKDYNTLMYLLLINVGSNFFDITFFFQGNEKFGIIAIRNIAVKIIGIVLIFCFVRTTEDLWIYALCQGLILLGSNLTLWPSLRKYLVRVDCKKLDFCKHFLPSFKLFIPTVAISIYTMIDRSLIGLLVPGTITTIGQDGAEIVQKISDIENGMYEQSEKMVKMIMTIVTSLGVVMSPRNSNELANGNKESFLFNIKGSLKFVTFIGFPIMFGLAAIAMNFSPWFYGSGFEKVPYLIMIFSLLIIIIGVSNVLGLQYLIPKSEDNKFTISVIIGALVNIILNIFLIPILKSYGAAIASVISELCVTIMVIWMARKDINFVELIKVSWKHLLSGSIMFVLVFLSQYFVKSSVLFTILFILEGIFVYTIMLFVLKDDLFLMLCCKIKKRICSFYNKKFHSK